MGEQKLANEYGDEKDTVDYSNISQVGTGTQSGWNANKALMSFKAPLPFSTDSQKFYGHEEQTHFDQDILPFMCKYITKWHENEKKMNESKNRNRSPNCVFCLESTKSSTIKNTKHFDSDPDLHVAQATHKSITYNSNNC